MLKILYGDPANFAIETGIVEVFERTSQLGIGYFVLHVAGRRFGVLKPDATLLACSYDSVERRLSRRGRHNVFFGAEADAINIVDAVRAATYDADRQSERFFGLPAEQFCNTFAAKEIIWAPDGDEAFDDGSHVLQFDLNDKVRLIAFKNLDDSKDVIQTIVEAWISADQFYQILKDWKEGFEAGRNKMMDEKSGRTQSGIGND
jgi:Immunity protein 42